MLQSDLKDMSPDVKNLNADVLGLVSSGTKPEPSTQRPSKYHNTRTVANGRVYDSGKEAARGQELELLQKAGEISCLCYQVPFRLPAGIIYIADFAYLQVINGRLEPIVEDVKSEITRKIPSYRMKRKLFKEKFGIEISEL